MFKHLLVLSVYLIFHAPVITLLKCNICTKVVIQAKVPPTTYTLTCVQATWHYRNMSMKQLNHT